MNAFYSELQWLPRAPEELPQRLKALGNSTGPLGRELQALASYSHDLNQLTKLAKAIGRARADGKSLDPLVPFRLAVLSNSTIDMIVPALVATAARHGVALEVIQPSYDQVAQEALTPDSKVNSSKPDAVLLALDYRALPLKLTLGEREASLATVQGVLGYLQALRNGIKANSNAVCIFQNFAPPVEPLFGSLDRALPGTLRNLIGGINRELAEFVLGSGDVLLDVAGLAETVGLADWHNTQLWNMAKFSFSDELIPLYADHVGRTIAAIRGKSKKVLILDLDNTVWGGVIGDDGLEQCSALRSTCVNAGSCWLCLQRIPTKWRVSRF
jgi:predicted enzyme involved in methoxymalonyl-ACP biosynthesis